MGLDGPTPRHCPKAAAARWMVSTLATDTTSSGGYKAPPKWMLQGRTVLIPKKGDLAKPDNYRLITCLNTSYKLMASVINEVLVTHLSKGQARRSESIKERRVGTDPRPNSRQSHRPRRSLSFARQETPMGRLDGFPEGFRPGGARVHKAGFPTQFTTCVS